jgi:hypothetical protein
METGGIKHIFFRSILRRATTIPGSNGRSYRLARSTDVEIRIAPFDLSRLYRCGMMLFKMSAHPANF